MENKWDYLLSEFHNLGGIAENICQRMGKNGRGIFPVNANSKSRIFTPFSLMVRKNDICLEEGKLRIKKDSNYKKDVRNFFNFYQDNFSWGAGGKEVTENFELGLKLCDINLKNLLKKYTLHNIDDRHQGDWDEVIKKQFLQSRSISPFEREQFIAPIFELVNHGFNSLPFIINSKGISTPFSTPTVNELKINYSVYLDPLNRFFSYGFCSDETIVYSLPFNITLYENENFQLTCLGKNLSNDTIKINRENKNITLEGLPIASTNNPKLPIFYFAEIQKRISDIIFSQDLFLKIIKLNIDRRVAILNQSSKKDDQVPKMINKVIDYELNLIKQDNLNY